MTVTTRFAPSPTGFLHIGGARTALFNWLFSRHHKGTFRLRIEDTDRQRSTEEAKAAILDGLQWLELDWDGEVVYQSQRFERHAEVARTMLAQGTAYRCFCSPQELEAMREAARAAGKPPRYDGRWRDRTDWPDGPYAIRLKAPRSCETVVRDQVQGEVRVGNEQLDDMVLLRADGTPTYMLSVVVDDHDMAITNVIRGDDHLTNTFRQVQIYRAMGWDTPNFAHIPLIHGADGAKLSKRHGALGVDAYRDLGYLPEAVRNYLLRLGWSHGDDEIISTAEAIDWFDLDQVGRSPARFDFQKLDNLNGHYLKQAKDSRLAALLRLRIAASLGREPSEVAMARLEAGMAGLKERAKTLKELSENALFYFAERPLSFEPKARDQLGPAGKAALQSYTARIEGADWSRDALESAARQAAEAAGIKLGQLAQPLRAALTGRTTSPPIFEVMEVLGREESLSRIADGLVLSG
jgi:glutamyl-tRNA synthetase